MMNRREFEMPDWDKDRNKSKFQRHRFSILLFFMTGVIVGFMLLSPDDSNTDEMCAELSTLMLNDNEHDRLHNEYPTMMIELHQYLLKSCDDIEDNMAKEINNPDRITINVGEP